MSVAFSGDTPSSGRDDGRPRLTVVPLDEPATVPVTDAEDAELVARARGGDPEAYAALFRRWFGPCRAAAIGVLGSDDAVLDPEDVAQEALVAAWARLEQLREPAAFGAWAAQISRNLARDQLKRRRPLVQPLHGLAEEHAALVRETDDPQRIVGARERDRLVRTAAGSLRGREGAAFERVVDEGMDPGQVAAALGVSGNNAYQILFRLRGRMHAAVRHALVWRQGRPRCAELARLVDGPAPEFTPQTAATVARHVRRCPVCTREADQHAGAAQLLSGSCVALWVKWLQLPLRLRPDEAVAGAQGVDLAVRVGAGIGVAATVGAGVLVAGAGLPSGAPSAPAARPAAHAAPAVPRAVVPPSATPAVAGPGGIPPVPPCALPGPPGVGGAGPRGAAVPWPGAVPTIVLGAGKVDGPCVAAPARPRGAPAAVGAPSPSLPAGGSPGAISPLRPPAGAPPAAPGAVALRPTTSPGRGHVRTDRPSPAPADADESATVSSTGVVPPGGGALLGSRPRTGRT